MGGAGFFDYFLAGFWLFSAGVWTVLAADSERCVQKCGAGFSAVARGLWWFGGGTRDQQLDYACRVLPTAESSSRLPAFPAKATTCQ